MSGPGLLLAIDTATRTSVVAVGVARPALADRASRPLAVSTRAVRHRHGSHLLEQVDEVLVTAGARLADVGALAVGTGPGSFTGLRVGLATAKTVAYARDLELVGVASSESLRRAAADAGAPQAAIVVLPAGAHDHYLVRSGEPATLVAPGELAEQVGEGPVIAVDLPPEALGAEAARLGEAAVDGLAAALLALACERLTRGQTDDVAALVPVYVALPRGVRRGAEELAWSPDLR